MRYAEALLINGKVEECLDMFELATEHLSILYKLPEGSILYGSVSVLDSTDLVISVSDKFYKCVINIGRYDKNPLFDKIREDKRFVEYMEKLRKFFPQTAFGTWVNEQGNDSLDAQWEMLLSRARREADKLSDGNVVVVLTSTGAVASISFQNIHSTIEAENAMKFLVEQKKKGEAKIERLICMWFNGSVDMPSFAFREALINIDSKNFSTQVLLNGLNGYVVKTVKDTMPEGYNA